MNRLALIVGILLSLAACGPVSRSAGRDVVVEIDASGFNPKHLEIAQGDTITFVNVGDSGHWPASNIHPTHRLYPDSGKDQCGTEQSGSNFDSCGNLEPGERFSFTFTEPGSWRFHDHTNPYLTGKVTVLAVEGVALPDVQTGPTEVPERVFDEDIPEDAPVIFQDELALYSYVRKYGAAKTIQYLYELETTLGDCHQTAHSTGRFAYEIEGARAFQTCSAECHSGCYHGATEAYFRDHGTANLAQDLAVICSSELNPFFSHQCFHGVGHGLMAFADYEIFEALNNCDLLPDQGAAESCYSGVYMENVVGGLAPNVGHYTDYLSDDPHFPCDIVDEKYQPACYFYQTSHMVNIFNWDFNLVAQACGEIAENLQRYCFQSMGRDVGGKNYLNNMGAIQDCLAAAFGEPRIWCLQGAVQNTFWDPTGQDEALDFCYRLDDSAEKRSCYDEIIRRAPLVIDAPDLDDFCMKAEADYQEICLAGVRET